MSEPLYCTKPRYPNWIRLIELQPERCPTSTSVQKDNRTATAPSSNQAVSCVLIEVPFSYHEGSPLPSYSALSYCWGAADQTREISLNGLSLRVTKNLEAALRQLRRKDEGVLLWVDALCINQSDDQEKAEQVGKMGQIFQRAASVVAWIGPQQEDSDLAMDWVARAGDHTLDLEDPMHEKHLDLKTALLRLFDLPYWSRIWIVQELVRARTLVYQCGSASVTEGQLRAAVNTLRDLKYEFWDQCRNPQNAVMLRTYAGLPPLIFLLRTFRHFEASLGQDKIFALLGLARDVRALRPDYASPCEATYTAFARALIDAGYVEILSLCEARRLGGGDLRLPSWVPDWSRKGDRDPLQQRELDSATMPLKARLEPPYSACGHLGRRQVTTGHVNVSDSGILRLDALFIGRVERLGSEWDNHPGQWLFDILGLTLMASNQSETPNQRFERVLRTAVADQQLRSRNRDGFKLRMDKGFLSEVRERLQEQDLRAMDPDMFADLGIWDYHQQIWCLAWGRRPIIVSNRIGLGPIEAQVGDSVCIFRGAGVPYVVRRQATGKCKLVGEAYVDGVMDGEAVAAAPAFETIELV